MKFHCGPYRIQFSVLIDILVGCYDKQKGYLVSWTAQDNELGDSVTTRRQYRKSKNKPTENNLCSQDEFPQ